MTLVVAIRYAGGVVLACDKRTVTGDWMKEDDSNKVVLLTESIGLGAAGWVGAADEVVESVQEQIGGRTPSLSDVVETISELSNQWLQQNKSKLPDPEVPAVTFIVASGDRIVRVLGTGYKERARRYAVDGSGRQYGEYILRTSFKDGLKNEDAMRLAVYTILETSRMDPNVGDKVSMWVFPEGQKASEVLASEIERISVQVSPRSIFAPSDYELVDSIVKKREAVSGLFKSRFGKDLFAQNERAIFGLMQPCHDEMTFSNNMGSLGQLIDGMDSALLKLKSEEAGKSFEEPSRLGSIGYLKEFLRTVAKVNPEGVTDHLEGLRRLRSNHHPIHDTGADFVHYVVTLEKHYPPNWRDLWLKSLEMYSRSLDSLAEALNRTQ